MLQWTLWCMWADSILFPGLLPAEFFLGELTEHCQFSEICQHLWSIERAWLNNYWFAHLSWGAHFSLPYIQSLLKVCLLNHYKEHIESCKLIEETDSHKWPNLVAHYFKAINSISGAMILVVISAICQIFLFLPHSGHMAGSQFYALYC